MIAKNCGLRAMELTHYIGNAHIYETHVDALKKQVDREPYDFPMLHLKSKEKIDDYMITDFDLVNYKYYPSIKMDMVA